MSISERLYEIYDATVCSLHGSTERRAKENARTEETRKAAVAFSLVWHDSVFVENALSPKVNLPFRGRFFSSMVKKIMNEAASKTTHR